MDKIILIENFGGLGDNLQFSTLPEEFKEQKNLDFYIHNSTYESLRNKEIFTLVWEMNPYFKGISDESPNAGRVHRYPTKENMICDIEQLHGLECKNNNFKLYYEPKNIGDVDILFDLTSTSLRNDYINSFDNLKLIIDEILSNNYSNVNFVDFKKLNSENYLQLFEIPNSKKIEINSIFEYCDAISSCRNFVGLQSGGSHLAKTYQKKYNYNITLIEPSWFDGWRFGDINYLKLN
jgi:hypothetical protein